MFDVVVVPVLLVVVAVDVFEGGGPSPSSAIRAEYYKNNKSGY